MPVHAFIFPGQGSQAVGMGRDLAAAFGAARDVFEEVDEALGQKLSKLMFAGDMEELTRTENAQPALMACSMATLRVLEREAGIGVGTHAAVVLGHSLGEWTALCAAGALPLDVTARLLRRRGQAMQRAVPEGEGAMAALIGVERDDAAAICEEARLRPADPENGIEEAVEVVAVANDNGGGQVVISGHAGGVERASALARARGAKRALKLPVSAPFHCTLMAPAAREMEDALGAVTLATPVVPLVANVTAEREDDPARLRTLLLEQITATVRWREAVLRAVALGCDRFVELGAGRVLSGLVRRIAPDARADAAGTPDEVEALARAF